MIRIAVIAFEGFNELDVFANSHILNRATKVRPDIEIQARITCASPQVTSMNGVRVAAQETLEYANQADAIVVGSGGTLDAIADAGFVSRLKFDHSRQLIASQCSGALLLAKLGLLEGLPACTDSFYRSHVEAAGVRVLDQAFFAAGNIATAGGCLSSTHLATWILWRLLGQQTAMDTLRTVAPVGNERLYVTQVLNAVGPYVQGAGTPIPDQTVPATAA